MNDPRSLTRPDAILLRYYFLVALLANVAFPFVMLPLWFRYHTLKYRFDDEGVSMSWGILWRREIHLTYRRIQDIHVTQNVIERWMGLSKVHVQTASGTAGATMTVEGLKDAGPLRDFLYERMHGASGTRAQSAVRVQQQAGATAAWNSDDASAEALALLREIRDTLRTRRERGEAAP